ncbi:Protein of unknown function [Pyronema omphalodes CBS 100304]|uniref:Uncharacterized protein n=1 Tax=Pyronema omphalodes (strain CBS 100304) TaxID=1076935 RepID=U4LJX2_PYROM|nr:Protein of unknown function [Pyronema omphalodes CBS 100304]CCX12996.1 Protein of unknown function [Pyronema omphalodes CBS 100304]
MLIDDADVLMLVQRNLEC